MSHQSRNRNNRTKSVLVGLRGVVKKAVGLGGWHWLVLTNGIEVKLQRNALSVIEPPTGNEVDDDLEFENTQWHGSDMASDETQKSHRSRHRMHRSLGSSHKSMSRSFSIDSQSKGSISMPPGWTKVDLSKLEIAASGNYRSLFRNPQAEQQHLTPPNYAPSHAVDTPSTSDADLPLSNNFCSHCAAVCNVGFPPCSSLLASTSSMFW